MFQKSSRLGARSAQQVSLPKIVNTSKEVLVYDWSWPPEQTGHELSSLFLRWQCFMLLRVPQFAPWGSVLTRHGKHPVTRASRHPPIILIIQPIKHRINPTARTTHFRVSCS